MDESTIRRHAEAVCEALVAGDVERATADFSDALRRHLGEVLALLPLPVTEATVETIEAGGSGYIVIVRLVGETDEVRVQLRWKDHDGRPRVVEASHMSRTERAVKTEETEAGGEVPSVQRI